MPHEIKPTVLILTILDARVLFLGAPQFKRCLRTDKEPAKEKEGRQPHFATFHSKKNSLPGMGARLTSCSISAVVRLKENMADGSDEVEKFDHPVYQELSYTNGKINKMKKDEVKSCLAELGLYTGYVLCRSGGR